MEEKVKLLLEEHDYYHHLHQKHFEQLGKERKERIRQSKSKQYEVLFAWKKEGEQALQNVKAQTHLIHTLLKPHKVLRDCFSLLDQYASSLSAIQPKGMHRKSRQILWNLHHHQKHHRLYAHPMNPTELGAWRLGLQKEFMFVLNEQSLPWHRFSFHPRPERSRFRQLFRYYASRIHVEPKVLIELKKKRYTVRMAEKKMKMIRETQQQCDAINHCKSIQHYHPKGCSNCGVIFIGGSLEGAIPYVKSLSRDTGVATLVTLAFELETLTQEEAIQKVLLEKVTTDLQSYEYEIYSQLIITLQQFWRICLLWKRYQYQQQRQEKSLYYYRIRRLVRMKQEIDTLIKEPTPIPYESMEDKYWDIMIELREYISYQEQRKQARIRAFAQRFHRKLIVYVEEARERRYQEWLRLQNLPKPPRPILIKSLPSKRKEVYICFRTGCHRKQFFTYDRYLTHMFVHKQHDYLVNYQYYLSSQQKQQKLQLEQQLYQHLTYIREQVEGERGSGGNGVLLPPLSPEKTSTSSSSPLSTRREAASVRITYPTMTAVSHPLEHQFSLSRVLTSTMFVLTLVSKSVEVLLPANEILLDQPVFRIGTHVSCEAKVGLTGELARLGMISKIHCLLYHTALSVGIDTEEGRGVAADEEEDEEERGGKAEKITIVDNSSLYGTYVVAKDGALKVPTKVTKGLIVQNGSLICVGVSLDGPPRLPVSEANAACLVFRLQKRSI